MARGAMNGSRGKSRGWALGTTLACMVALAVVLFAAVSAAISHLRMVSAAANGEHAKNLAEAALAKAMVEVVRSDYKFGKNGTDRVQIYVPDLPGSSGIVTFDQNEFGPDGKSTFNLDSDTPKTGARSHNVPARTVHLVARGKVGSSESWMECVYYKPPFPDGLAASGPIDAKALYLAGIRRGQAYAGGDPGNIPPEDSIPANLFTNATGPNASLVGVNCRITGSAGAVGSVTVDPTSVVEGEVLPGSEPRAIPNMDIPARMAALRPNAVTVASSGGDVELDKDWFSQATSGLTVGGNLKLNGSVLLVDGDLNVGGAIEGTGVVLVNGNVEITDGRSNVTAADQVAVACTGDFKLHAQAPEGNYFQGLVYCEGDFEAKDITVVGATVVNGKNGKAGSAKLDNVRFVQSPGGVNLELSRVRGRTIGQHSWAWSISLRPNPNGTTGDFLADARLYFTDWEFCSSGHDHDAPGACPSKDNALAWRNHTFSNNDSFAMWDSVSGSRYRIVNSGPGQTTTGSAYPDGMPIKLDSTGKIVDFGPMRTEVFDFFTTEAERQGTTIGAENGHYDQEINDLLDLRMANDFVNSSYQVTFNLNTLLGESMGTTRTLLWKPFR